MIKTSKNTIILFAGLVVTVILRMFFEPYDEGWEMFSKTLSEDSDTPLFIYKLVISIFMPAMMEGVDFFGYLISLTQSLDKAAPHILTCEIRLIAYILLFYFLEKYHEELHNTEKFFTMCVDLMCIENISFYLLDCICYLIGKLIFNIPGSVLAVIAFLFSLPALWLALLMLLYFFAGMLISMGLPVLIMVLASSFLGEAVAEILAIPLMILCSQVLWRLCSHYIFKKLFTWFTFHRFDD